MTELSGRGLDITILIESNGWGGAELHTIALARTLGARGHRVTVGLLSDTLIDRFAADASGSFEVLQIASAPAPHLSRSEWKRRLTGLPGDVCVFAKNWFATGSLNLELAARSMFGRYVTIEHLLPPPRPKYARSSHLGGLLPGLGLWWLREVGTNRLRARCPDHVFTVSEAVRGALVQSWGYRAGRVTTIHNGIHATRFAASPSARTATRIAWGIPESDVVFGIVGRLASRHKGCDLAIDAFNGFRARRPESTAWLVFVGDGPDRDALVSQAERLNLQDRIRFVGHSDTPALSFPAIDFLLMPSRVEGLPLALMEGMASGCVPIAARVSGIPEVVSDQSLGWLMESGDVGAMVSAMIEAVDAPPERLRSMQAAARGHIIHNFSADTQFALLASGIERVAARHSR